ncbi:MAG: peptidase M1 [Chitinophagales bacterium]|nr:MAG: peptidase M1 [Chitinophagales bacterium]
MPPRLLLFFLLTLTFKRSSAQHVSSLTFTRADTLRGALTPLRSCYDVTFYDLSVQVFPDSQFIRGTVVIHFIATENFRKMQIDLFDNMQIHRIRWMNDTASWERMDNAVFVHLPQEALQGQIYTLQITYSGKPLIARLPPWDGGFIWTTDNKGNPWIAVACEGIGASLWWPNKDHLSDEPDSARITIAVPDTLVAVSNGRLQQLSYKEGWAYYTWKVSYPINNYNITLNVGKYVDFTDTFVHNGEVLDLHYYIMSYNKEKAREHFAQVKPMLRCFTRYLGPYPFVRDGFKLVETPYLGMEHQSCIAYGNNYQTGYAGKDYSGIGLDFDYIIIHESGHEWWGNAVSCSDLADLWIHEGFCTYSEALYVECLHGYATALAYLNHKKKYVRNESPIIGVYQLNREGSLDMYNKGALILHTLRSVIGNDSIWFSLLHALVDAFSYKTCSSAEIEDFISTYTGIPLDAFFDQYLRHASLPVFTYQLKKKTLRYRWSTEVSSFNMPVMVTVAPDSMARIYPTTQWQEMPLKLQKKHAFKIADDLFYIGVQRVP